MENIQFEPIEGSAVRLGDLLVYHPRPQEDFIRAPELDRWVTHRVIRRLQVGGQTVFLTKRNDQQMFAPVIFPDQIVGRVIRAGNKDLTTGWRRVWGVTLAQVSYLQAILTHRLMCLRFGRLDKLRWLLTRRGRNIWF